MLYLYAYLLAALIASALFVGIQTARPSQNWVGPLLVSTFIGVISGFLFVMTS